MGGWGRISSIAVGVMCDGGGVCRRVNRKQTRFRCPLVPTHLPACSAHACPTTPPSHLNTPTHRDAPPCLQSLAVDISLAALLGEEVYNFGELLLHPIVSWEGCIKHGELLLHPNRERLCWGYI